jgi:hypothetical protein
MDFYRLHPHLYQLRHPWHWLSYGQNATASGIILAAAINLFTIYVLWRTLRAVNRQATAADRQARAAEEQANAARKQTEVSEQQRVAAERAATAAEEQVKAAMAASATSEAQRIATEDSANAERLHSELIRHQMLAHLRPILVFRRRIVGPQGHMEFAIENHGEGVALSVKARYANSLEFIQTTVNIIGPNQSAVLNNLKWSDMTTKGLQLNYSSQDGRSFVTTVAANAQEAGGLTQESFETNANGGSLAPIAIPRPTI